MADDENYRVDIDSLQNNLFDEFESELCRLRDNILDTYNMKAKTNEEKLNFLSEENEQLRIEINAKETKMAEHKRQYESYKKDQNLLYKELKETHEAYLMAKKYFKIHLSLYYTIEAWIGEKQSIFVQFFTKVKKESDLYSIWLHRDTKTGVYQLLETKPKLEEWPALKKTLQETQDLPGTLHAIRKAFIKIKSSNNDE